MKIFLTAISLFIASFLTAQTSEEVLKTVNRNYSDVKPLQFTTSYSLYKNVNTKNTYESYKGFFKKNANNEYIMKIGLNEIVSLQKVSIKTIEVEKIIEVSEPIKSNLGEFDLKQLLEFCKIKSFKDLKTHWEYVLETLAYSNLPYSRIIVEIGKDNFIKRELFYYNTSINFSKQYNKQDLNYPVLEINFSNYNRLPIEAGLISSNKYFKTINSKLVSNMKNYKLIDQRKK